MARMVRNHKMLSDQYVTYTDACSNKINNNDERTHFFRKIYLSLYSKGLRKAYERVMCERWVGDWTNCNILTPNSSVFSSTSFSFCWIAQSGVMRAHSPLLDAGSLYSILSPIQLTPTYWTCHNGLYHCLTPTCFLWASHLQPIQPVHGQGYILMSSTGCACFSIDSWAEGQYVTDKLKYQSHFVHKQKKREKKWLNLINNFN